MNFDGIAPVYDRLAWLTFGRAWTRIQEAPASHLQEVTSLLIVGGGTGMILEKLPAGQQVTYLEASAKMLKCATFRKCKSDVTFVHKDFLTWQSAKRFDAVLMPFFLDCFGEKNLGSVITRAWDMLAPGGSFHVTDFQGATHCQNLLIMGMYAGFRCITGLEGNRLLPHHPYLVKQGFSVQEETTFWGRGIYYRRYTKP